MIKQLYMWTRASYRIPTINGRMFYLDWLQKEQKRLQRPDRHVEIRSQVSSDKEHTEVSLWGDVYCQVLGCYELATQITCRKIRRKSVQYHVCDRHTATDITRTRKER